MAITMMIQGIPNAVRFITRKKLGIDAGITVGMIEGGNDLKNEVKESIAGRKSEPRSIDTGEFYESIDVGTTKTSATVFSDVDHAKFMEYGTSRIPERRHFRNSMARKRSKIVEDVNSAVKKAVKTI